MNKVRSYAVFLSTFCVFSIITVFLHTSKDKAYVSQLQHKIASLEKENQRCKQQNRDKRRKNDTETLWLARVIYSETKNPLEMPYVAWVVRNRVDLKFRGATTYKHAALDPYQFSAFNHAKHRAAFLELDYLTTDNPSWTYALRVAEDIQHKTRDRALLPQTTLYFYSEISMNNNSHPSWRHAFTRVYTPQINTKRFRFYQDKTCTLCQYSSS